MNCVILTYSIPFVLPCLTAHTLKYERSENTNITINVIFGYIGILVYKIHTYNIFIFSLRKIKLCCKYGHNDNNIRYTT